MSQPLARRLCERLGDLLLVGLLGCLGAIPLISSGAALAASIGTLRTVTAASPVAPGSGTMAIWWHSFRTAIRTTKRLSLIGLAAVAVGTGDVVFALVSTGVARYPVFAVGMLILLLAAAVVPHAIARASGSRQSVRRALLDGIGIAAAAPLRSLAQITATAAAFLVTAAFPPIAPLALGLLALLVARTHDAALRALELHQARHA